MSAARTRVPRLPHVTDFPRTATRADEGDGMAVLTASAPAQRRLQVGMAEFAKAPGLDYIQAPKLVAVAFNTFLREVLSNARTLKPLPPRMVPRVAQLEIAQKALSAALGAKHGEDESADPKRVEADRAVDDAVRAYYEFLSSMGRMPSPIGTTALNARSAFFPKDDLSFLNFEFDQEWSEIDTRLNHAEEKGTLALVEEIGGAVVIANLKKKHKEYGRALGVTTASARSVAASLEVPYGQAQDALRRYIAAAIAHGAESDLDESVIPEAETLLAPIEEARARNALRRAKGGKGAEDEEGDDDAKDPAKPVPAPGPAPGGSD